MTEKVFEAHIRQICAGIDSLPEPQRDQLARMAEETRRLFPSIRGSRNGARDALDDLRLYYKYLVFDAEARAREAQAEHDTADPDAEW